MQIEDIVLIKYNKENGIESNFVMTIGDYMDFFLERTSGSEADSFKYGMMFAQTRKEADKWVDAKFFKGSVSARLCLSEGMLIDFINGKYKTEGQEYVFKESLCSEECLDYMYQVPELADVFDKKMTARYNNHKSR